VHKPGLRERKKQQTRETIERVALELFAERGYENTTLADIAEAADVSPRTIFAYFESKEDILFCEEPAFLAQLKQKLEQRPPDSTTVDALRDFLSAMPPPDEGAMLRKKIITDSPSLELKMRARHAQFEPMIAASIRKDLGSGPDDVRPHLIAASMTAAFTSMKDRIEADSGRPLTLEQIKAIVDDVLEFVRGGLEGLRRG
jgi:AcrR family transcriptional regulator